MQGHGILSAYRPNAKQRIIYSYPMHKLIIFLITVFVLCVILRLSVGYFSTNRIATGLITSAGATPTLSGCDNLLNCTSSTANTNKNLIEPIAYQGASTEVIAKIATLISKQKGTKVKTQNANYLHATYKTLLVGYTDDLELLVDQNSGVLNIRSASRIGRSDLGANRKRIEALRVLLDGKI